MKIREYILLMISLAFLFMFLIKTLAAKDTPEKISPPPDLIGDMIDLVYDHQSNVVRYENKEVLCYIFPQHGAQCWKK